MKKLQALLTPFVMAINVIAPLNAQTVPSHAQGLTEVLIVVDLNETKKQAGVSVSTDFVMTANNPNTLSEPIRSRCLVIVLG